jgi:outer membrane receptor protein involved in Fe transport
VFNPEIAATGLPFFTKPSYQILQAKSHTLGAKLTLSPTGWWLHNLTAGIDRYTNSTTQTQPRLTTPDDTFFTAVERDLSKTFIAYNSSILGDLGKNVAGSVTVGFDHYSLPFDFWASTSALSTSGATGNVGDATAIRTTTNNTGYFAQAMVGIRDAVFLTGGVRAEENTQFGSSVGTPVSPQFGLTYVKQLGGSTIKVRGSWGRAIRPPGAGAKVGSVSPFDVTLPNPLLGPERQKGWDTGVDAVFGRRGSLSLTYFNQTALDLISLVVMPSDSLPTFQNQNVGRVKNTGVEIEALLSIGVLSVRGQYGYVRSRIQDPGSTTGELVAGDELLDVPTHTAGVSVSVVPRSGTVVTAGATYVGDYLDYDYMTMLRCFAETGPCLSGPGLRAYRSKLPSLFKVNAAISQQITPVVSGFVSVNNLTNNEKIEFNMFNPVMGRITTVGLQFHQ